MTLHLRRRGNKKLPRAASFGLIQTVSGPFPNDFSSRAPVTCPTPKEGKYL